MFVLIKGAPSQYSFPLENDKFGPFKVPLLDGRIVGGKPATIQDFPYQLSLQYYGQHFCGASIITQKFALTAGHCAG